MKVIFTDHVPGVAHRGDVKNVRGGFFRNYLMPYKKAVPATEHLLKDWEERRKRMLIEKEQLKTKLEETMRRLAGAKAKIEKKVTKKGTLYGGIKAKDITAALKEQFKLEVPETAVVLTDHIKAVGTFDVKLNFGEGVETIVPVEVVEKK
ncbi:50S ribosomal protein L9 [Candidatus Peregrinibacteria bacterium]|nr:50S ribosomal protein L9 [Candidatus Peregrinibacteria bacterium]